MSKKPKRTNVPPKDIILTRRKLAQLNTRELRNQDVSRQKISQITQLLRSPKSEARSPKKRNEYYPDKLKRKLEPKKVVLKPKHKLKVVAVGSKRKGVPQKEEGARAVPGTYDPGVGLGRPPCDAHHRSPSLPELKFGVLLKSPPCKRSKPIWSKSNQSEIQPKKLKNKIQSQLSIEEMVRQTDSEILNDEDFLEILTCESPVWWEDPPDEGYCEDPIYRRAPTATESTEANRENDSEQSNSICGEPTEQALSDATEKLKIPQRKEKDEKFMKKRSKLENLLGNIKTKLIPQKFDKLNDEIISNNNITESNENITEENISYIKDNTETKINAIEVLQKKEKRLSGSIEGDDPFSNLRDDDLLRDLENMDIPVEPMEAAKSSDDCIIIDTPTSSKIIVTDIELNKLDPKIKNKIKIRNEYLNILRKKNVINTTDENEAIRIKKESEELPLTITNAKKETFSSPRSISDDTINLVSQKIDSISDTNVCFIDEDDSISIKSNKESDNKRKTDEKVSQSSNKSYFKPNGHNCLTVYKIITRDKIDMNVIKKDNKINLKSDDAIQKGETADGKLNSLYKKFKNNLNGNKLEDTADESKEVRKQIEKVDKNTHTKCSEAGDSIDMIENLENSEGNDAQK